MKTIFSIAALSLIALAHAQDPCTGAAAADPSCAVRPSLPFPLMHPNSPSNPPFSLGFAGFRDSVSDGIVHGHGIEYCGHDIRFVVHAVSDGRFAWSRHSTYGHKYGWAKYR